MAAEGPCVWVEDHLSVKENHCLLDYAPKVYYYTTTPTATTAATTET